MVGKKHQVVEGKNIRCRHDRQDVDDKSGIWPKNALPPSQSCPLCTVGVVVIRWNPNVVEMDRHKLPFFDLT